MTLTFAGIGFSLALAYRPGVSCASKDGEACAVETPRSVRKMRTMVWIMALASLALVLYPYFP